MIRKTIQSVSVCLFQNLLTGADVGHFVSTRLGGFSDQPYGSLNLSYDVGDDREKVARNRKHLAKSLKTPLTSFTLAKQIHDSHVQVVTEPMRGRGSMDHSEALEATDAMVTDVPNICLVVLVADCVPILVLDPAKKVVGVIHAGWKGTLQHLAEKAVRVFREDFGCSPDDLLAGVGPAIGPCCYQVGPEVISQVDGVFGVEAGLVSNRSPDGKGYLDLTAANARQLVEAGIPEKNIERANTCTAHHSDLFFSHRCEKGKTGRFGAGIMIRDRRP